MPRQNDESSNLRQLVGSDNWITPFNAATTFGLVVKAAAVSLGTTMQGAEITATPENTTVICGLYRHYE